MRPHQRARAIKVQIKTKAVSIFRHRPHQEVSCLVGGASLLFLSFSSSSSIIFMLVSRPNWPAFDVIPPSMFMGISRARPAREESYNWQLVVGRELTSAAGGVPIFKISVGRLLKFPTGHSKTAVSALHRSGSSSTSSPRPLRPRRRLSPPSPPLALPPPPVAAS